MAKRAQVQKDPIAAAREVARAEVARRWPDLAGVEPTVTPRQRYVPDAAELGRLGASSAPAPPSANPGHGAPETGEYTFTFAGQTRTPDGYIMPRVARVTVDSQRRVIKATASK
jgi:hypothetical protein